MSICRSWALSQILNRKHMKRAMETHLTMYLVLYCVYLRAFKLKGDKLPTETIKSKTDLFIDAETKDDFKHYQNNLVSCLAECSQLLSKFDDSLNYQSRFLRNYMNMVEVCGNCIFIPSMRWCIIYSRTIK